MKKFFLMLAVLFIALCLFVSCDDDSSDKEVVSTWKRTDENENERWIETYELVLYKDGTFTFVDDYKGWTDDKNVFTSGYITEWKGTYTFKSDIEGTFSGADTDMKETIAGSFVIDGDSITMTLDGDEDHGFTLTKV